MALTLLFSRWYLKVKQVDRGPCRHITAKNTLLAEGSLYCAKTNFRCSSAIGKVEHILIGQNQNKNYSKSLRQSESPHYHNHWR